MCTMMNFTLLTTLLLCSLSWISESHTVNVQPGGEATLLCSNISNYDSITFWFRIINGSNASCIAFMLHSKSNVEFCGGLQNEKIEMSSNSTTLFLKIKKVGISDSGLYLCGFYSNGHPALSVIPLHVEGNDEPHEVDTKSERESVGITKLTSVILGGLTIFLVLITIGLVVQNKKLQKANTQQNPEQSQTPHTEDLNYAAVTFQPKGKRRELETNVIYAATR